MDCVLTITSPLALTPKKLFKRMSEERSELTFSSAYEIILKEFRRLYKSDFIDEEEPFEEDMLDYAVFNEPTIVQSEVYSIFITVYFRCISLSPLNFGLFKPLHVFMVNLPPSETTVSTLQFLIETIGEKLGAKESIEEQYEALKIRFYLTQTLAIFASLCENAAASQPLLDTYTVLIKELGVLNEVERLGEGVEVEGENWVNKKGKWVLVLENVKCLSLLHPEGRRPLLFLRYSVLYYIWKIAKINMTQGEFKSHEKTLQMITSILLKNSTRHYEANGGLEANAVLQIFNENMILLKFLTKLINAFPELKDYIELYLEGKFKFIVISLFSLMVRTEEEGLRTGVAVARVFRLLEKVGKEFAEPCFEVHKEVFDFFVSIHKVSRRSFIKKAMKEVANYCCEEKTPIKWLIKVLEFAANYSDQDSAGERLGSKGNFKTLLILLHNNASQEATMPLGERGSKADGLSVRIMDAVNQVWAKKKVKSKEAASEIRNFVYEFVEERKEILQSIEWGRESCFAKMLLETVVSSAQHAEYCSQGVKLLSRLIRHHDESVLKNHQEAVCSTSRWIELFKSVHNYGYVMELLQFIKDLCYNNGAIKGKLEGGFASRKIKLGKAISRILLMSNPLDMDQLRSVLRMLMEITFEADYDSVKQNLLQIKNTHFFAESISLLYNLLPNTKAVLNSTLEILASATKLYENYSVISSVTLPITNSRGLLGTC